MNAQWNNPTRGTASPKGVVEYPDVWSAWQKWIVDLLINNQMPLSGNVTQWIKTWGQAVTQMGLINIVNENNSRDPDLEVEILSTYSYGKQLGRIIDVLTLLVDAPDSKSLVTAPIDDSRIIKFKEMARNIDDIKNQKKSRTIAELQEAIENLRKNYPAEQHSKLDDVIRALGELRER